MITHVRLCWILRPEILGSSFEQKTFTRHLFVSLYNSTFDLKNISLTNVGPLIKPCMWRPSSDHNAWQRPRCAGGASQSKSSYPIVPNYSFPSRASLSLSPPISLSPSLVCSLIWRRNLTAPYRCQRWRGSGRFVLTTRTVTLMRLCPRGSALFVA